MDITAEKLNLIQQILLISDEKLIKLLTSLIEKKREASSEVDGWDELPESQKEAINESIAQLEAGDGIPLQEVLNKYRERYRK